jgi:hypothetical protein
MAAELQGTCIGEGVLQNRRRRKIFGLEREVGRKNCIIKGSIIYSLSLAVYNTFGSVSERSGIMQFRVTIGTYCRAFNERKLCRRSRISEQSFVFSKICLLLESDNSQETGFLY